MLQVTIWTQMVSFTVNPNFHRLHQIDTNVRKKNVHLLFSDQSPPRIMVEGEDKYWKNNF